MSTKKDNERKENLTTRVEESIIAELQKLADESEMTLGTYTRYVFAHAAKHRLVVRHTVGYQIPPGTMPSLTVAEHQRPFVAPPSEPTSEDEPPAVR